VTEEELQMARQLVESLSRPFEPDRYENEHKRLVLDLVQRKIDGEEVPVAAEVPEPAAVPDLMAALRASIDQAKGAAGGDGASADAASGEDGDASEGNGEPKKKPARKKSSTGGSGKGSNGAKGKGRAASKS
jgi:DNA end-binding protein Ku